ncbi:MAG: YdbH domain-containing protein [Gammaproteobacteria bacterium]
MSLTKKTVIVLLILISTVLTIALLRPELVLSTLAKPTLSELGFEISSLEVNHLGTNSLALEQLVLISKEQRVVLSRLYAQYSLSQFFAGTAQSISIGKIELRSLSSPGSPIDEADTTLAAMLDAFDALPVSEITLPNVELLSSDQSYLIGFGLQSPPLRIVGDAQFEALQDTVIEFEVQRTAPKNLTAETRTLVAEVLVLESKIDLNIAENAIAVAATSSLFTEPLQAQLEEFIPSATAIMTERLSLQSNFEVQELFGNTAITQLSLVLDSPNSHLQISQESDRVSNAMQLRLPLSVQGNIATSTGEMQLNLSEIYGSGSWTLEDATSQSKHSFENTQLHCTSFTRCDMQSDWQSDLISWRYGEYIGENTRVTAPLRFNYSNDEIRLAADLVQILVPSVRTSAESVISELATSLQLNELEFRAGDVISGGFNFSSSEFRLDNGIADISNPAYSGKLKLEKDTLTGVIEVDIDQRLRLGIGLQHFFLRDTGDVVLKLAPYEFTEAGPLSTLITPKELEADIVAGQIEGLANISWSKQLDDSWRFGGPIALKIGQLSGYYADYLFVDLNTDLFAEATTPLGIQVSNPASASLSRIDIGLPLEELSWQYRFNTLIGEIQIFDFDTSLLDGKLSIPAASYNSAGDRQQVDVVLTDLRVDSVIALAEYPGLEADGLISGYLPFIIDGDTISVEKGLVGALKPGGSIRYTPANSVLSSDPGLQLVNDALSNYQYQTMDTEVFYFEDGELLLNVQLQGSNPDMNNGQAINLNVNITDNIPSLLKSLQASRVITDELERFVSKP